MKKRRRKPRYCRECGKPLRTSKTGLWFFCAMPADPKVKGCQEKYAEMHEPDVSVEALLRMRPTDEDNYGTTLAAMPKGFDIDEEDL